ncbi:MAG: hypothetical protein WED09_14780 [Homoserinimonas sp.]
MSADGRLAIPAAVGWALLAIALATPSALPWAAGGCWSLALLSLIVVRSRLRQRRVLLSVALSATLAGLMLTAAALAAPARWPGALVEASETGAVVRGLATTTQAVPGGDGRFTAILTEGTVAGQQFDGSVPVLVFGAVEAPVGIGAELQLIGSLGQADAAGTVAFLLFLDGSASVERVPPWALTAADNLRDGFGAVATSLPGDGGDLLPGLAIGDTSAVADSLDSAMKASALSHLTAVSGGNCRRVE